MTRADDGDRLALALPLALAFLSGFVALSYEIVWFRTYSFAAAGAADAFALLLGAYLAGLSLGALFARRLCDGERGGRSLLRGALPTVLAASALAALVTPAVAALLRHGASWKATLPLVVPAAALLGSVFPLVAHAAVRADAGSGRRFSLVYLANILGSTTGSLATGFFLLDRWPLWRVSIFLALLSLAMAGLLPIVGERVSRPVLLRLAGLGVAAVALAVSAPALFGGLYESLMYRSDYVPGTRFATVDENKSGVITVTADGVVYGSGAYDGKFNTLLQDDRNGIYRAYALAGLHPAPRRVLMIGLSTGSWATVIANLPGVEHLTVVEINPGYLDILSHRPDVAPLLHDPRVDIEIDDGRRWLVRNPDRRFDAIVANTTFHWRANASNLLSTEFLDLVRAHLAPGGVYLFNSTGSPRAQATAVRAFASALRIGNCVAVSDAPLRFDAERFVATLKAWRVEGHPVVDLARPEDRALVDKLVKDLTGRVVEDGDHLARRTRSARPITDDNMGTEWSGGR